MALNNVFFFNFPVGRPGQDKTGQWTEAVEVVLDRNALVEVTHSLLKLDKGKKMIMMIT